tara:strand:- start:3 stop:1892 length:1890 start_codon:yes stop_codon:yes gene_type:complete
MHSLRNNSNFILLVISFLVFVLKCFFSYYEYGLENLFIKFLFNPSGDYSYFPFVHQLSNFTFDEGYSVLSDQNDLIGFPFLVIIFHAIFYKIFGLSGFFLIEFLCIFIFLKIFFEIFKEINFNKNLCIIISLFLFSLFPITSLIYEFNFPYSLNLKNLYSGFYSLRFPRPLITNLFFFGFVLFSIKFFLSKNLKNKKINFLICAVFLGLLFNSFFYFFIQCFFIISFILILEYRLQIFKKDTLILIGKFTVILAIISSLFLTQIFFIESDYFARIGTITLFPETKLFLLKNLFSGFLKIEFLLIFLLNVIFYYININLNVNYKKFIFYFFLMFLSSILSPIIYIVIMNKVTFFGNFTFIIALSSLFLLKINLIIFLKIVIEKFKIHLNFNFLFVYSLISLLLIVNTVYFKNNSKNNILSEGIHFNFEKKEVLRKNLIELTNFTKKKLGNNLLLLTNDIHTQLWWIFSNEKKFYFPYVFFVSLNDKLIEKQLFNAFKILKLDEKDFLNFINQNKITDWRIVNTNNYFFLGHLKYQANYLTTYNSVENYPDETHKFLKKRTTHLTNQVILNKNEVSSLIKKFEDYKLNDKLSPDLIIILKNNLFEKNLDDLDDFNLAFENDNYLLLEKANN